MICIRGFDCVIRGWTSMAFNENTLKADIKLMDILVNSLCNVRVMCIEYVIHVIGLYIDKRRISTLNEHCTKININKGIMHFNLF